MKFIGNKTNGEYLENILQHKTDDIEEIKMAVAYAKGNPKIFDYAIKNNIKLTYFCRYDYSTPVAPAILKTFLDKKSMNYRCYLVPDILHAKVIWFVGRGVYIGSANLTDKAWYNNIEYGTYFDQEDILEHDLALELESFFDFLLQDNISHPLSEESYEEILKNERKRQEIDEANRENKERFDKSRIFPINKGLVRVDKKSFVEKAKSNFLKEWNATLQIIRDIAYRVALDDNRPKWISANIPEGIQVDQFFHAYYYNLVKSPDNANKYLYNEFFEKNKSNPDKALENALSWWKNLEKPPSDEDNHININAPYIQNILKQENIDNMSKEEFIKLCKSFYAFGAVARQVSNKKLGLSSSDRRTKPQRIELLAEKIWNSKSPGGHTINEVLKYVVWGGSKGDTPLRLWNAIQKDSPYHMDHFGLSCLGELVGGARPNEFPPRNGRTSKALYALGNQVKIHTI